MRFIHFSDIHVWRKALGSDLYPKRFLGLFNLIFRRSGQFPVRVRDELIQGIADEDVDAVLFTGDLTTTSYHEEFEMGRDEFAPLMVKWRERFIAIPGNHDRYTPHAVRESMFESNFLKREQAYPFVRPLNDQLSVVGIDCCVPRLVTARGEFTAEQARSLKRALDVEAEAGRSVIVLGHYPFAYPQGDCSSWQHRLGGAEELRRIVDRPNVAAYLHGHCHRRWALKLQHAVCLNAGSAGKTSQHPNEGPGYLRFSVENGRIREIQSVVLQQPAFEEWVERSLTIQSV